MVNSYNILDLGKSDYKEAWELQKKLQSQRISGEIDDQLLLVEHFPVYTLGKNAPTEHLLINDYDDISIVQSDRGGNVTFHGPGQLVAYPILDLNNYNFGIQEYAIPPERTREMFPGFPEVRDGYMWSNGKPGLGIDLNEEMAKKFPFKERAYGGAWGPARRGDGSMVKP